MAALRVARGPAVEPVPRVGGDDGARGDDPYHFSDALGRIGHEENHQRHDGHVERVVGERLSHRVALTKLCAPRRGSRASKGELRLGRIDSIDRHGRAAIDDHFRKGAVAAADVEPAQA